MIGQGIITETSTTQVLRSDNFNRADGAIGTPSDGGSAWSLLVGTWVVSSNQASDSTNSEDSCVLETSNANVAVQATFPIVGTDGGLIARAVDSNNMLIIAVRTGNLTLYKKVAGGFTQLGQYVATISNGDIIKLACDSGNNLTVYQNGVSRITANDAAGSTNTQCGLRAGAGDGSVTRWDDFSVSTL